MDARKLGQHTSHRYDDVLEAIRQKLLSAGGLVENQLKDALAALSDCDSDLGQRVISSDPGVQDLEVEIDQLCMAVRLAEVDHNAEHVIYFARGKDVRHHSIEEMRSEVRGYN